MITKRYLFSNLKEDLNTKMVFIGGPRQVGKTTLAKSLLSKNGTYLNWDDISDRQTIKTHQFSSSSTDLIFDEIHKYSRWRMLLKGLYDKHKDEYRIIATGSARLDYFRKGGDSLFGRHFYYRLHPLSANEINKKPNAGDIANLLQCGSFPEPFFKQDQTFLRRWQNERAAKVFQSDLRDIVTLKDYSAVELLNDCLKTKVGSLLSKNSLGEDLEKSPMTIESWLSLLENIYACFRVAPYGIPRLKTNRKQQKLYLWDYSVIQNQGARFENFVASHLLKYCHFLEDTQGFKMELKFLRDKLGHEIDFVVVKDGEPQFAVECKSSDGPISNSINYFSQRSKIPKFYQVHLKEKDFGIEKTGRVLPFWKFCQIENLV